MKLKIIIILIGLSSCVKSYYYTGPEDYTLSNKDSFWIMFEYGFKADTVSVSINNIEIFNREILSTNQYGVVIPRAEIKFDNDTLIIEVSNKITKNIAFKSSKLLNVKIQVNENPYNLSFNIKNGRYIFLNNKRDNDLNLNFEQFKKMPIRM